MIVGEDRNVSSAEGAGYTRGRLEGQCIGTPTGHRIQLKAGVHGFGITIEQIGKTLHSTERQLGTIIFRIGGINNALAVDVAIGKISIADITDQEVGADFNVQLQVGYVTAGKISSLAAFGAFETPAQQSGVGGSAVFALPNGDVPAALSDQIPDKLQPLGVVRLRNTLVGMVGENIDVLGDAAVEQTLDIFVANSAAGNGAGDDLRLGLYGTDGFGGDGHQFCIDFRFLGLDDLAHVGFAQEAGVGFVPHFPMEDPIFEMLCHGFAVVGPALNALFTKAGGGEEVVAMGRQRFCVLHIQAVAEAEAKPRLNTGFTQIVYNMIQPIKIIHTRCGFGSLPTGLEPCPLDTGVASNGNYLVENITGPVIQ